ncbi:MAG: hypothetical protein HQ589_08945 [Syntrophaceae bacterium]|nr:hypothetical protein [Syntrophaceae bacterium]
MDEKQKGDKIKLTIIVPCQRCGANHYQEIASASKYIHLSETITNNTKLVSMSMFGKSRLICRSCVLAYETLADQRAGAIDEFFNV